MASTSENTIPPMPPNELLKEARDELLNRYQYIHLFPYQKVCSDAIIDSVVGRQGKEIYIEFSRQSGKTTLVALTVYILALLYWKIFNKSLRTGIFAPTYRQTNITFRRIKDALNPYGLEKLGFNVEINNGDTFVLTNSERMKCAEILSITAQPGTTIKGETFDWIICEECLPYEAKILTNRGWIQIGKIVKQKMDVKVLSVNRRGELEFSNIDGYLSKKTSELVRTEYEGGYLISTPNHRIYTDKGWIKPKDLNTLKIKYIYGLKNICFRRSGTNNPWNSTRGYKYRLSKQRFRKCEDIRNTWILPERLCNMEDKENRRIFQNQFSDSGKFWLGRDINQIWNRVPSLFHKPLLEHNQGQSKENQSGISKLAKTNRISDMVYGQWLNNQKGNEYPVPYRRLFFGGEQDNSRLLLKEIQLKRKNTESCPQMEGCEEGILFHNPTLQGNNTVFVRDKGINSCKHESQMERATIGMFNMSQEVPAKNKDERECMFRRVLKEKKKQNSTGILLQKEVEVYDIKVKNNHNFFVKFGNSIPLLSHNCQDIDDRKIKEDILPMGAATNATNVFIGTPSKQTRQKFFYEGLITTAPKRLRFINGYEKALEFNPYYEEHIKWAIERYGADSVEFRTQYMLEWVLEASKFITPPKLYLMRKDYELIKEKKTGLIYAGMDVGKDIDSTVVTVIELDNGVKRILNWLELQGEDYESQVDIVKEFLSHYEVKKLVVDTIGVGDPVLDFISNRIRYPVEGYKWTPTSHHEAFKFLWNEMRNNRVEYPAGAETQKTREFKRFEYQFLDLNKGYKGELMRCHHPDETGAHDDYCSSLALAVMGLKETQEFSIGPDIDGIFEPKHKEPWEM